METKCFIQHRGLGRPARTGLVGLVALCSLVGALLFATAPAQAQTGAVTISEIYYNAPGADEGMEFIELLNTNTTSVDLGGYTLSGAVDFVFPVPTVVAAGASIAIAASAIDFETKFGFAPTGDYARDLANSSDTIVLNTASGAIEDRVQYFDYAPWPVSADGDGDSLQLVDPTLDNNTAAAWLAGPPTPATANRPNSSVLFDPPRGFFGDGLHVTLTPSVPGATIEYAINGGSYRTYTDPVWLGDNGGVRGLTARIVIGGSASVPETHSYVFAQDRGTPVVVQWPNGLSKVDGDEWTGSFEFIAPPSVPLESVGANAGWRANSAGIASGSSEKVYFRSEYGAGTLRADLFSDVSVGPIAPEPRIDQLALRNQQGDPTHVKQVISHDALASLGLLSPHSRFVHLYESGSLSGIRQLQERPEGGYMEAYTGHDKSLWNSTNWTTDNLLGEVKTAAARSTLDEFKRITNLEHFIGYSLVDFLAADGDGWWKKNWRITGPANTNNANGADFAWHFFLWDEDAAWGSSSWSPSVTNRWSKSPYEGPEYLFVDLMDVLEFRFLWADAAECAYRNRGPLSQEAMFPRVVARVNELAQLGHSNAAFLTTMSTWMEQRSAWLFTQFVNDGLYPQDSPVEVTPRGGRIAPLTTVSATTSSGHPIWYTTDGTDPRLPDGSLNPVAIQAVGGSLELGQGSTQIIARSYDRSNPDVFQRWSATCPLEFDRTLAAGSVVINELHYNPRGEGDPDRADYLDGDLYEFIELHNPGAAAVSTSGWAFTHGIAYEFPVGTSIPAGGYLVLAKSAPHFAQRYGFAPDGEYDANLANGGELVELATSTGLVVDSVTYDDVAPWPAASDGLGPSLALREPDADNAVAAAWALSAGTHGDPGSVNELAEPGDVDANSVVDDADVIALLESEIGIGEPIGPHVGDMTGDRVVDLVDAMVLAQRVHAGG